MSENLQGTEWKSEGKHRQKYAPKLSECNPEKKKKEDWFDELCKKHGAKNLWKKDKK